MIHVGPLTHAAANYMIPYYLRGARSIVLPHFDPVLLQETIHRERVNHLLLLPTMTIRLMDELQPDRFDLSCVTRINYGTAPMPVPVLKKAIAFFGPVFRGHYGLAEAVQPQTVLYPWEHVLEGSPEEVARLASCGRPIMGVDIRIRDGAGAELPAGEIGEITIALGSNAITHYWRRPEATAEAVRDGWLYTGDLGRMDADGYLFIVGRKKDMIITGSYNVYAHEVEDALFQHPGILDAAVLGVPDKEWGESICAYVVPRGGATLSADEVVAHCRRLIAGYKKPRFVEFIDEIPKNNNGKVDKNKLRERFLATHDQRGWEGDRTVLAEYR